jgi:hypothetical protein
MCQPLVRSLLSGDGSPFPVEPDSKLCSEPAKKDLAGQMILPADWERLYGYSDAE